MAENRHENLKPTDSFILSCVAESDFCVKEKYGKHSESEDTKTPTKSDAKSRSKISDKGSDYCSREYPCDECEGTHTQGLVCVSSAYC